MYPLVYHKTLSPAKWMAYPDHQQILMIANELNRAGNALRKGALVNAIHAWERAFELTDLTVEDPKWSMKLKELLRFRETLGALFLQPDSAENELLTRTLITLNSTACNAVRP